MEDNAEDMFSCLPDEILGRIVSFLPIESALHISLLSTRWRDLWNEALVRYGTIEDTTGVVAEFLANFEEFDPLKHPRRLRFHFGDGSVLLATIATNNKLLLDFSSAKKEPERHYGLQLKLDNQHITYQSFPPTSHFLVKALCLKSVCYLTCEVVSSIVSRLQHLENLSIIDCSGLQSLCIDFETKLLKLTIVDCLQLKSLQLNRTSKLQIFLYRGLLPQIRPENHFNLADAMLDFRVGPSCSNFKPEDFDAALLTIKNSEILTLCEWNFRALIWPSISHQCGSFMFYKLRELWWIAKEGQSSDALVSFLKLCPALEQLFVTIDPGSYFTSSSSSCFKQETKYTELEHLKLIKLMGFTSPEDETSLAKDLFQLVKGKPPRIETSDGTCFQCLCSVFSYQQREPNKSWVHVREEKDINNSCPRHAHMGLVYR